MSFPGLTPGFIASYDGDSRTVRVRIPGITDGSDTLPLAVFAYPIGDGDNTEILIQAGDKVWLAFENGDPRYPIIMGYRSLRSGNAMGWRRWSQSNIELKATNEVHLQGTTVVVDASGNVTVNCNQAAVNATTAVNVTSPQSTFQGNVTVNGLLTTQGFACVGGVGITSCTFDIAISSTANIHTTATITGDTDVIAGGKSGKTHVHADPQGGDVGPPI